MKVIPVPRDCFLAMVKVCSAAAEMQTSNEVTPLTTALDQLKLHATTLFTLADQMEAKAQ